jgi:hypothetical protein
MSREDLLEWGESWKETALLNIKAVSELQAKVVKLREALKTDDNFANFSGVYFALDKMQELGLGDDEKGKDNAS